MKLSNLSTADPMRQDLRELLAMVDALRERIVTRTGRASGAVAVEGLPSEQVLQAGPIELNVDRHEAIFNGCPIDLTATEFRFVMTLARRPGWVLSRGRIIDGVYGPHHVITDRTVDVMVAGIRRKLGRSGDWIETVRGVGYRLKPPNAGPRRGACRREG